MNEWWGYIHKNETIQVKRFFDHQDLRKARESEFVVKTVGPFLAKNREDAIRIIKNSTIGQ